MGGMLQGNLRLLNFRCEGAMAIQRVASRGLRRRDMHHP